MFQKKFSLLIKKCTHFIWQEKYFCLQREEGHTGSCTTQERNGLRQNYSSSVNFSPSLKPRHSCPILDFLVTPAFHNFPQELQSEPSALTQTPCANQGQFWWILVFFPPPLQKKFSAICKPYLQSYTECHFLGVFHLRSENFLPWVLCWWPELLWGIREKIKTALNLTLLSKPRKCCCHFYHGICVHTWKKSWKYTYHN